MDNFQTSTAYLIAKENLREEAISRIKSALSTLDLRTKGEIPKAFFDLGPYIAIPKIRFNILQKLTGTTLKFKVVKEVPDVVGPFDYNMCYKPMEHQVKLIDEALEYLMGCDNPFEYGKRLSINLNAGMGKTFIAAYLVSKLKVKFIFLVNSSAVAKQAYTEFTKMLRPKKDRFLLVTSSKEMHYPPENIQGIFMTHSMFRSVVENYGIEHVRKTLMNDMKFGLKIMDEFDMEVANMYYMDTVFNFKYNIYLTATQYKSILDDDKVYQLIYGHIKTVGRDVVLEQRKDIHLIKFKSSPSPAEFYKITQRDDMFKIMYNNCLGLKDIQLDYIMEKFYIPNDSLMKKIIRDGGQIAFFCGRIATVGIVKQKLIERYGIREEDIGELHTKVTGEASRNKAKEKPFLITITQSFGRGVDSPILRCLVYLEFTFSMSSIHQSVSRVGRVGKKYGYVIYPVDFSFTKVIESYNKLKRKGFFKSQFKNINFHVIPEEKYKDYVYGYRIDSKTGKDLITKYKNQRNRNLKLSKALS